MYYIKGKNEYLTGVYSYMEVREFQKKVLRTTNPLSDKNERIKNYCFGLGGEAGELLDLFKKYFYHGHKLNEEKIKYELGDILWYVANISNELDYDLEEIMDMNIDKLNKRYPNGFSEKDSINRKK
jgi:NTP pyrophosphatase (non-canonical NTP hydrolase)